MRPHVHRPQCRACIGCPWGRGIFVLCFHGAARPAAHPIVSGAKVIESLEQNANGRGHASMLYGLDASIASFNLRVAHIFLALSLRSHFSEASRAA